MMECQKTGETEEGRYVYAIVDSGELMADACIGIEDSEVYTVPYMDIAAVAHACKAVPYQTDDSDKAKGWLLSHCYVIDRMTKKYGSVLPFSFDAIIKGDDGALQKWLGDNYDRFKGDLARMKDRSEYVVQIFYDQDKLVSNIIDRDAELKALDEKIKAMPRGAAYIYKRKFEVKAKDSVMDHISGLMREFGLEIGKCADGIKVEDKPLNVPDQYKAMKWAAAFTCLVHKNNVERLGEVLDRLDKREGFRVRFSGPWAPFSFVNAKEA